jgi:hypothetical protein
MTKSLRGPPLPYEGLLLGEPHFSFRDVKLVRTLDHSIACDHFAVKAVRTMKLARAALIYLTQAVYLEECRRSREVDTQSPPMVLNTYEHK